MFSGCMARLVVCGSIASFGMIRDGLPRSGMDGDVRVMSSATNLRVPPPPAEENRMTSLVQEFATYCEQNSMPSYEVGSAAFYANWLKLVL